MNRVKFEKQYPHLKINNNSKLTNKEKEEVKSLIRLGDSTRLAITKNWGIKNEQV